MTIYTTVYLNGQLKRVPTEVEIVWKSSIDTAAHLPTSGNFARDARYAIDSNHLYVYLNGKWNDTGVFDVADLLEERLMQGLS
jgi:hypothetical protein